MGMPHKLQMKFLKQTVGMAKQDPTIKAQLINGAREGLKTKIREWDKKKKVVTKDTIMAAIREDNKFMDMMKVLEPIIVERDLENMVHNMVLDYNRGKLFI